MKRMTEHVTIRLSQEELEHLKKCSSGTSGEGRQV